MKIKLNLIIYLSLFFFCFSFVGSVQAAYGPKAYVTEYVSQDYWWNGSTKGTDVRKGQVQVSVPNNWDVLQYVRVNLTGPWAADTDLVNNTTYANTVTSYPTTDNKQTIYVNITGAPQASSYNITNINKSPTLNLSLNVTNWAGGTDIYDGDNIGTGGSTNTLLFNLTVRNPSSTKALNGVTILLQFNVTTGRDIVNITAIIGASTGSPAASDTNANNDYDRITWTGINLGTSGLAYLTFNVTLLEGASGNMGNNINLANLDGPGDKGVNGNYTNGTDTHSGITISYKLARSSIRQGVDLQVSNGMWYARGLIKNMANGSLTSGNVLTYNITEWRIYTVDPSTGAPYLLPNISGRFNQTASSSYLTPADGQITTMDLSRSSNTSWYNTSNPTKPYIAVYFDWYVVWNDTQSDFYAGYINTTMDMQTLYKVDLDTQKSLTGVIYPDTGNQPVTVMDNATNLGENSTSVGKITIYSIIPVNITAGPYHGIFNISNSTIKVYYYNGSMLQLAGGSNVNWTATNPILSSANGTIRLTIADLSTAPLVGGGTVGHNMSTNDKIILQYDVLSNSSMTTGDSYTFTGNTTFTSASGTSDSEYHTSVTIEVSAKRLIGYKDLFIPDPSNPNFVNATLFVGVSAQGSENITGIKFIDYVLNGTFQNNVTKYVGNLTVRFFNGVSTVPWVNGTDYKVTFNGTQALTDGTVVEIYEFTNATAGSTGFQLNNTQNITVNYQMNIGTSGTYILPLQIAAFDPSTGETFAAQSYGVIRVDILSPALPLQITDHNLELAKRVVVGTPAMWIKNFEVY
ncbi:MAG: hypothetical protein NTY20_03195, partial [Candidatus Aenigmarchaeota archaeon]|nr:hypothetical protein [Candidatus Aenigmarchaeota archaeon]